MTQEPNDATAGQLSIGHDESLLDDDQRPEFATKHDISEALAAAEAEAERLRDKQAAVREAESVASRNVRLDIFRQAANSWAIRCNCARSRAQEQLEKLSSATKLNVSKLQEAFIEFKLADARCGSNRLFASMLDRVDPLPDSPIGAPQTRNLRTGQHYADLAWSRYFDQVINQRAQSERDRCWKLLQSFEDEQTDAAVTKARDNALALDDYERLDVATPPRIAELHRDAVAALNPAESERASVSGTRWPRAAQNAELEKLIDAGN